MKHFYVLLFVILHCSSYMMGEENERATSLVFQYDNGSSDAFPLSCIDSLTFGRDSIFVSTLTAKHFGVKYSEMFLLPTTDTLKVYYDTDQVRICNPNKEAINISANESNIKVFSAMKTPMVVEVSGTTSNGSLYVQSDSAYTTIFNNITLKSLGRPAFYSALGKKVKIILPKDTENSLCDDSLYVDSLVYANGCLSSLGRIDFEGEGKLTVSGSHKHAIYSKKDIKLKKGNIFIAAAASDGIHSGKGVEVTGAHVEIERIGQDGIDCDDEFTMTGGSLKLTITADTSKGVKCKKEMTLSGGYVNGLATGGMYSDWGDNSFCTLLKCDSDVVISGDTKLLLQHEGVAGKCISCAGNFYFSDASLELQTFGDGCDYFNYYGFKDYVTPKCISVDGNAILISGTLSMQSIGVGGKGLSVSGQCFIGQYLGALHAQGPNITVSTTGRPIVNLPELDYRDACPKAIKSKGNMSIYSGDIHVSTSCMGGEGIECLDTLFIYGGNVECLCFDDGINVDKHLQINGGAIYCFSEDNDGIDSNKSIEINSGVIVSQSNHGKNESFDTRDGDFSLNGGIIFGLDPSGVDFARTTGIPYYSTENLHNGEADYESRLSVMKDKIYHVVDSDNHVIMSLTSKVLSNHAFFTVASPLFCEDKEYFIYEGEDGVLNPDVSFFNNKFTMGGTLVDGCKLITRFCPTVNRNL